MIKSALSCCSIVEQLLRLFLRGELQQAVKCCGCCTVVAMQLQVTSLDLHNTELATLTKVTKVNLLII